MRITARTPQFLLFAALGFSTLQAQVVPLPAPDAQGWIRLFRGSQDAANFYTFMSTSRQVPSQNRGVFPNNVFTVVAGDTIRSAGNPSGHLIHRQPFSHYRMQFQLRWPGTIGNTGVLTKVQENDTAQSQGFPRSVECQGDPNQGMGQIWALGSIGGTNGGTWITVRARMIDHPASWPPPGVNAAQYDPASPEISYGGLGDPNDNLIVGQPGWQQPRPAALNNGGWITIEVESHGRDTSRHFVDGQLVMQYRDPRIAPRNNANQVQKYLTEGLFAWQSEGSNVWFRNMRIMLFPQDPLYPVLYPTWIRSQAIRPKIKSESPLLRISSAPLLFGVRKVPVSLTGRTIQIFEGEQL